MVLPAVIGVAVGAQVVSGLMQYYQSEKAAGANAKRLKEIEALFNKIVPPELDISIFDDPRVAEDIPAPMLDMSAITPKDFASVGQYVPEVATYVAEANPKLVEATAAATKGREAQMGALSRYRDIASRGGMDALLAEKLAIASDKARGDAASAQQNILQDAQRRGMLGSGLMAQSQMGQTADAMRRQAIESQMAAAEAYRNQMMALDKSASLGGDVRASEMSEQARNADIINAFNQRTSKRYQDYLQYRSDIANRANLRNLENQQDIANMNTRQANEYDRYNREMRNRLMQQNFQNKRTAREDVLAIEQAKQDMIQRNYQNKMGHASAKKGIAQDWMNYNTQRAQDTNQAIRGVGDAVTTGAMYYQKYAPNEEQQQKPKQQYPENPTYYDDVDYRWASKYS